MPNQSKRQASDDNILVEAVKLLPQILWIFLAAAAFFVAYPLLSSLVEEGGISKVAVAGVQIELTRLPDRIQANGMAIAKQAIIPEEKRSALTKRFKTLSKETMGTTVLWVDDKHPYQNVRERRVLQAAGINVDLAQSEEEALKWVANSKYDIVITDLSRPGEDEKARPCYPNSEQKNAGCELLKKIYERTDPKPKMIVYAGNIDESQGRPPHSYAMTNRPDELMQAVLNAVAEKK